MIRKNKNWATRGQKAERMLRLAGLASLAEAEALLGRTRGAISSYLRGSRGMSPEVERRLVGIIRSLKSPVPGSFRVIDLFAGIGGMRLGFEAVGGRCVFTCEWNEKARETYRANFGDERVYGDIRGVRDDTIPAHDVLLAGFPCQPFSIAGVSKKNALGRPHGFDCRTQGTLFFEIERILARHRPAAFLLENVKNLRSHDRGRTFAVIERVLREELGYHVWARVVDAKGVVPQHRERIFVVGFREPVSFEWEQVRLPAPGKGPRLRSILHPEDGSECAEEPYTIGRSAEVAPKYRLSGRLWKYLREYKRKHKERGSGFGFGLVGPDDVARTLSARYYKDGSEILVRRGKTGAALPRRLTPRECARLMGFDTPGGSTFRIPVSDVQAYKQFGNAVVVPVVRAIARAMQPHVVSILLRECLRDPVIQAATEI